MTTPADPPTPPADPPADPPKTFTQDDVNRLLAAEKRKLLADQPDLTELRRKAAEFEKLEDAQRTALEREKARGDEAEKRAATAEQARQEALLEARVTAAAVQAKAIDPSAVLALLDRKLVTFGDDGQVTGVDDAVKAVLDAKPYLVGTPGAPPPTPTPTPGGADGGVRGTPPGSITREQLKAMSPEAIDKAHRDGQLDHLTKG